MVEDMEVDMEDTEDITMDITTGIARQRRPYRFQQRQLCLFRRRQLHPLDHPEPPDRFRVLVDCYPVTAQQPDNV